MTFISSSPEQTRLVAQRLAACLQGGECIAFYGPMGAGKTCFISALAAALGCTDRPASPTFAIVNRYRGPRPVCHFDMYRIGPDDLEDTGFYDYLDAGDIVAAEWCENIPGCLPPDAICVTIDKGEGENDRIITVEGAQI